MDKQKAMELVRLAPAGWGYYSEHADSFFCKMSNLWCVFDRNRGGWGVCEPSIRAERDMMPKSEILKIAEGEEMKDKSYPYIGYWEATELTVLFVANREGLEIEEDGSYSCEWSEHEYKNITPEFLQNTYGEVVSPEHAEFIIELCRVGGIDFVASKKGISKFKYFRINESYLGFYTEPRNAKSQGLKKITIPLPPKQIQTATPEDEFEMEHIMKNAGDNLVLGCESQLPKSNTKAGMPSVKECKSDEWPKIGDEVLVYSSARRLTEIKGKAVKVIGKCAHSDGDTILTVEHTSLGVFAVAEGLWVKKPKTPEEELRDELAGVLSDSYTNVTEVVKCKSNFKHYARDLMSKYNITKKPQ